MNTSNKLTWYLTIYYFLLLVSLLYKIIISYLEEIVFLGFTMVPTHYQIWNAINILAEDYTLQISLQKKFHEIVNGYPSHCAGCHTKQMA